MTMSGYFGEQYHQQQQHQQYDQHQEQYQQEQYQQEQYQQEQYQQEQYQQQDASYDEEQMRFQQRQQQLQQRQFDLQDQMQELQRQQQSLAAANYSQGPPTNALYQQHQHSHHQQPHTHYQQQQQQQQQHFGSSSSSPSIPDDTSQLYKTELCRGFMQTGACRYGDKCQFAHGLQELRSTVKHPLYKTTRCKSYQATGRCRYGNRCRFIHGESELELAILPRGVPAQNLNIDNDVSRGPALVPIGSNQVSSFQASVGGQPYQAYEQQQRNGSIDDGRSRNVAENDIQFSNLHYQLSSGSSPDPQQQTQGGIMRHLSNPELSGDIRRVPSAPAGLDRRPSQSSYSSAYDMSGIHRALSGVDHTRSGSNGSIEHSRSSGRVGPSSSGHSAAARLVGSVDGLAIGNGTIGGGGSFEQRSSRQSSRQAGTPVTSPSSSLDHSSMLRSRQFHSIDNLDRGIEGQHQQQPQRQQRQQHGIPSIHTSRSSAGVESLLSHSSRPSGSSPSHMPVPVPSTSSPFAAEGRERQREAGGSASLGMIGSQMYSSGGASFTQDTAVTSDARSGRLGMSMSSVDVAHEYNNNDNNNNNNNNDVIYTHSSSQDVSREYISSSSSSSSSPTRRVVQSVPFAMDRMVSLDEDNSISHQTGVFANSTTPGISGALSTTGSYSSSSGGAGVVFEMGDGDGSSSDEDDERSSVNLSQFSPQSTSTQPLSASTSPRINQRLYESDLGLPPLDAGAVPFSLPPSCAAAAGDTGSIGGGTDDDQGRVGRALSSTSVLSEIAARVGSTASAAPAEQAPAEQ